MLAQLEECPCRGPDSLYPPEFRADAVRLYRSSGNSLMVVSSELGVWLEAFRG